MIGQGGKIMRPAEKVEPEHVQGCGLPGCPICMPMGGGGGGARGGMGGAFARAAEEMQRSMARQMSEAFKFSPGAFAVRIDGQDFRAWEGGSSKAAAAETERRRRGPIEKYLLKTKHTLAWDDVVGSEAAREALVEAIEHPVKHAELYRHYDRQPTKGVLLYGPPGCGKTMFGKAAASILAQLHGQKTGERTMLSIKGPEIQSPYVGVTEETIRNIYAYARAYKALHGFPLVVFIDEADALLPSRDGAGGRRALAYEESQVAAFLAEMDGLDGSGAFTILATNRPDAIDAAILRDGRCDRKIRVERPNRVDTQSILLRALAGVPVAPRTRQVVAIWAADGPAALPPPYVEPADPADIRTELAAHAAYTVFADTQVLQQLVSDRGPRPLYLSDIVSGAMLVGIIEQAKAHAFRRDLAAGGSPGGLMREDLDAAIASVVRQNAGLNHYAALVEIGEREGLAMLAPAPRGGSPDRPPPRYALDDAGGVIQIR